MCVRASVFILLRSHARKYEMTWRDVIPVDACSRVMENIRLICSMAVRKQQAHNSTRQPQQGRGYSLDA